MQDLLTFAVRMHPMSNIYAIMTPLHYLHANGPDACNCYKRAQPDSEAQPSRHVELALNVNARKYSDKFGALSNISDGINIRMGWSHCSVGAV